MLFVTGENDGSGCCWRWSSSVVPVISVERGGIARVELMQMTCLNDVRCERDARCKFLCDGGRRADGAIVMTVRNDR